MGSLTKNSVKYSQQVEAEQFAYFVSHDLKTPLRSVSSIVDYILEKTETGEKIDQQYVVLLRSRLKRMYGLINALQELAQVGYVHTDDEIIDLAAMLRELDLPYGVQFIIDDMPIIKSNSTRIYQIFSNLVVNAVKHHHTHKNILIEINCIDKEDFWEFSVKDNGPGIDPKYHEKIFDIFQTLKSKDEVEGTGLGLALIKKIVTQYGGTIRLKSELGKGSTFIFTIKKEPPPPKGEVVP